MHNPPLIHIIEDEAILRDHLSEMLKELGYNTIESDNGYDGLHAVKQADPDLVITDVNMPGMNGFELCKQIRQDKNTRLIPIIILTGSKSFESRVKGINVGADDFLTKPFQLVELKARVGALLKIKRYTDDLENAEEVIFSLAVAADAKDHYTQDHCYRLSATGAAIGNKLGLDEEQIQAIKRGGILHDIGKIGVPDAILQKPGRLTDDEWKVIRSHPGKGEEICRPLRSLALALPIIRGHHERIDGRGYPDGLEGDDIPVGARIIACVDYFDAITTNRPYRQGSPLSEATGMILSESENGHLDKNITELLLHIIDENNGLILKLKQDQDLYEMSSLKI